MLKGQQACRSEPRLVTPPSEATSTSSHMDKARKVDLGSRVAFPIAYTTFVLTYWVFYTFWDPEKRNVVIVNQE